MIDTGTGHSGLSAWVYPERCGISFFGMKDASRVRGCARIDQIPIAILVGLCVGAVIAYLLRTRSPALQWGAAAGAAAVGGLLSYFLGVWFEVRDWRRLQAQVQDLMMTEGMSRADAVKQLMRQSTTMAAANRTAEATEAAGAMVAGALGNR